MSGYSSQMLSRFLLAIKVNPREGDGGIGPVRFALDTDARRSSHLLHQFRQQQDPRIIQDATN